MKATIRIIGKAIRVGSHYGPIRSRAAKLAGTQEPKDYLGQARAIFDDFVRRWRYVKDPVDRELVALAPHQVYQTIMGGDNGRGVGDCDDATVAIGAQLQSIGIPVRIATIAPLGFPPGRSMTHVFAQAHIPGRGWVTVDPVVYPHHGFGYLPPHSRMAVWNLDGKVTGKIGNVRGQMNGLGGTEMSGYYGNGLLGSLGDINQWADLAGLGDYNTAPVSELPDFADPNVGIAGFGAYAGSMGLMGGMGLVAEVDEDETGRAWTPALELSPTDYNYVRTRGRPYAGMVALGDNGNVYEFDGGLGFFRKIFRRVRKRVRKIARKVLKKIPGGKYLLKLGKKIFKVVKKFVRPLAKFVGKVATKLAPVAALIPGYGPAISAALYTTGKVAKLMHKYSVKLTGKKGKPRKLKFPSGSKAKEFQKALKKAAKKQKRRGTKDILRRAKRGGRSRRRSLRGYEYL